MILQNGNLAWVGEVFANFDNKSKTELVSLNALASWGIILGNESFVAKMISCKRGNLSSVECTEYLRLALQAQKFSVAQTLLEYQPENIADAITHRQIILNYLLHLMVIEKGALSSIIFLLDQGAAPDNIIREENALMAHSLFKEHNKYQLGRVLAYVSSACAQKISQDSKTVQSIAKHLATEIREQGPNSYEGIQLEDICSRDNAYSHQQSLFHRLCIDNRPDVLAAIGRSMLNRH